MSGKMAMNRADSRADSRADNMPKTAKKIKSESACFRADRADSILLNFYSIYNLLLLKEKRKAFNWIGGLVRSGGLYVFGSLKCRRILSALSALKGITP